MVWGGEHLHWRWESDSHPAQIRYTENIQLCWHWKLGQDYLFLDNKESHSESSLTSWADEKKVVFETDWCGWYCRSKFCGALLSYLPSAFGAPVCTQMPHCLKAENHPELKWSPMQWREVATIITTMIMMIIESVLRSSNKEPGKQKRSRWNTQWSSHQITIIIITSKITSKIINIIKIITVKGCVWPELVLCRD